MKCGSASGGTLLAEREAVGRLDTGLQGVGKGSGLGFTAKRKRVAVETNLPFIAWGFC